MSHTVDQLSRLMSEAMAPAFVLAAVASFTSILVGRMTSVIERLRSLNDISDNDSLRAHLRSDIPRLQRRASLLNMAIHLVVASGICTSLLLIVGFLCAFFNIEHIYGAAALFVVAVAFLSAALLVFVRELMIGLIPADHYR
jgi:hypothetical protein